MENAARQTQSSTAKATEGMKATRWGILTNLILALVKFAAGIIGNSYALIADAIESMTDIATSSFVYFSLRLASRPPDEDHPYGHGKWEPIAAMVVSLALFLAAIGIAIQSIREIITPHRAPAPWTLFVILLVILLKEGLYQYQKRIARRLGSTAIHSDAWHHRSDAITSLAVFFGIAIALIGGPGWEAADDWAALFASGIIAVNAWLLLRPALMELTDAVPVETVTPEALEAARAVPGVIDIEKVIVRKMGFDLYLDLHLHVDGDFTVSQGHGIAHHVKDAIIAADGRVADVLVHVEPPHPQRSAEMPSAPVG